MSELPTLHYDFGSPYAYLAVERAAGVFGFEPRLSPIVLGVIFRTRGYGSWLHTPERDRNIAEIEQRAERYGLPPIAWQPDWPPNTLQAMRAAIWAERYDLGPAFTHAVFRAEFAEGRDVTDPAVLREIADSVGLPGAELEAATTAPELKEELKRSTAAAQEAGVNGVPTVVVGDTLFFGDDQLERAAAAA